MGFSSWSPLSWITGSRCLVFSSCSLRALEHRFNSCGPWIAALRRVGSPWVRDRTHVPCIGRQILIQCVTWEIQEPLCLTLLPFSMLTLVRQSVMGGLLMASFKNATWGSYPLPLCFWYSVKCNREQRHSIVLATVTWTALLFLFEPGIHLELLSSGCFFVTHVCSSLHWRFIDLDIISVLGVQHDELISLCIVNW